MSYVHTYICLYVWQSVRCIVWCGVQLVMLNVLDDVTMLYLIMLIVYYVYVTAAVDYSDNIKC